MKNVKSQKSLETLENITIPPLNKTGFILSTIVDECAYLKVFRFHLRIENFFIKKGYTQAQFLNFLFTHA